jgi:outer membrane murein-binding lipoprotein Lpp
VAGARNVSDGVTQLNARVDRLEKEQGGKFDKLGDRIDHDTANRIADIAGRLDKLEAKANITNAHDLSGAVAQLGQRLDHIEKDQSARLDKLGERLDHDASGRNVELTARLEKLEAKIAAKPIVAAVAPSTAKPTPVVSSAATKFAPPISDEVTGSIERPRPQLRGYFLSEVHNGYAMIDSPAGEIAVAPGDMLPGGGRVLRIERRGRTWAVVTTQGQIVAMDD